MKRITKLICLLLCLILSVIVCSCSNDNTSLSVDAPTNNDFWDEYEAPDINISEIGGSNNDQNIRYNSNLYTIAENCR